MGLICVIKEPEEIIIINAFTVNCKIFHDFQRVESSSVSNVKRVN